MAPLEPLAGTAELAPTHPHHDHHHPHQPIPRQRSLSVSSHAAQTHLSNSITSLRSAGATSASSSQSRNTPTTGGIHALTARLGLPTVARRTLGIALLLVTVCLWTASNFLASYIFSDHTYDKPFFVVYINTSVFAISLVPMLVRFVAREGWAGVRREVRALLGGGRGAAAAWESWRGWRGPRRRQNSTGSSAGGGIMETPDEEHHGLLAGEDEGSLDGMMEEGGSGGSSGSVSGGAFELDDTLDDDDAAAPAKLGLRETAVLSLEFCGLWFCANYFASACLEYTSVGSVTILTSTSSVWTLVFCALLRVDSFTLRKLVGVLASLAGVVLISSVDLSGASDEDRGTFPHKSVASVAVGDGMAFFSAIVYGLYVTVMKRRVGDEEKVDMPLFFGLVGLFNLVLLWPGFLVLHWTGIEPFSWPPTGKVWAIIVVSLLLWFFCLTCFMYLCVCVC